MHNKCFYLWLTALILLIPCAHAASVEPLDRVIAVVNNSVITQAEQDLAIDRVKKQFAAEHKTLPAPAILTKQVLNQLIDRKLQLQAADLAGIRVSDADVTNAITVIARNNNITPTALYEKLSSQGLSLTDYRNEIHDEIVLQQIQQQEVSTQITLTPEEIAQAAKNPVQVQEYHLVDIVLALPAAPSTQTILAIHGQAERIMAKINLGTRPESAIAMTGISSEAVQIKDLGWRTLAMLPPELATQIARLKPYSSIGPTLLDDGFHIIKLLGVRHAEPQHATPSLAQQLLYQQKYNAALPLWIAKLRSAAYINFPSATDSKHTVNLHPVDSPNVTKTMGNN